MYTYKKGCVFNSISDIKDKKVTVMGLGLNGGGEASVRFFLKHGAYVTVTDMKTEEQLKPTINRLENDPNLDTSRLTYVLGHHEISDFENADCVIKNPGVKIEGNKYLASAKNIETDISIFLHFTHSPIIAVTGSKGKSSTVSAINYGLNACGIKSYLGGNITVSPLTFLEETTESTPVVLELSSWQLADLRGREALKPFISIITKIVPDHQNWYGNMKDYVADKELIFKDQDENSYTIIDADEDEEGTGPEGYATWGQRFASLTKAKVLRYTKYNRDNDDTYLGAFQCRYGKAFEGKIKLEGMDTPVTILKELSVPGDHMKTNVLNAAMVLYLMRVNPSTIIEVLGKFQGIDHRLQYFHKYRGNKFYNDSCATVPESTSAASLAFDRSVILLTGGTDKGLSFNPLIETLTDKNNTKRPKSIYLLQGTGTDKLTPALDKEGITYHGPYSSLEEMLHSLKKEIDKTTDEIVVFSPGATSFGMFSNEFDRGNKYMQGVKDIFQ